MHGTCVSAPYILNRPWVRARLLICCCCLSVAASTLGAQATEGDWRTGDRFSAKLFIGAYRFDDFPYDPVVLKGIRAGYELVPGLFAEGEFRVGSVENLLDEEGLLANVNGGLSYRPLRKATLQPYGQLDAGYYEFTGFKDRVPDSQLGVGGGLGALLNWGRPGKIFAEIRYTYFPVSGARQLSQYGAFFGWHRDF